MHPDAVIKGLRRELASVPEADKDRRAQILAEIERVDALPRPRIAPEVGSFAVADADRELLIGLRRELARAEKARQGEIQDEIDRVEALVAAKLGGGQQAEQPKRRNAKAADAEKDADSDGD